MSAEVRIYDFRKDPKAKPRAVVAISALISHDQAIVLGGMRVSAGCDGPVLRRDIRNALQAAVRDILLETKSAIPIEQIFPGMLEDTRQQPVIGTNRADRRRQEMARRKGVKRPSQSGHIARMVELALTQESAKIPQLPLA
ncbi:MAG: hypothetical protein K9L85_03095 [Candidatus Peribacteraceae bacterium]|nr:hypothetical protein [Candidatus Peribacteraceae bacterium]